MRNYKVGYGRPPVHSRFKPGICPNPKGRGRREECIDADLIREILAADVFYHEGGKRKRASRAELSVKRLTRSALSGNVKDAAQLLKLWRHGFSTNTGPIVIKVTGGLPKDRSAPCEPQKVL